MPSFTLYKEKRTAVSTFQKSFDLYMLCAPVFPAQGHTDV